MDTIPFLAYDLGQRAWVPLYAQLKRSTVVVFEPVSNYPQLGLLQIEEQYGPLYFIRFAAFEYIVTKATITGRFRIRIPEDLSLFEVLGTEELARQLSNRAFLS